MDGAAAARPIAPLDEAVFSYETAFSRNLGWLTEWEQQSLRHKRVAIAGMGGVGGVHLMTLARFGIGAFTIADPDRFELANFNRQVGATLDTIGRPKVEVLAENARKVNPELAITCFERGVDERNIDEFLAGVDLYIDALDFFVLDIRRKLTDRCGALGIPVINAAPIGMGVALLVFQPGGMSFEEWFRLDGLDEEQQYVSYLLGMAPGGLHRRYLADPSRVDLRGRRGPSTPAACELCAGVAAVEAVKLLLGRGPVKAVPYYRHFDAYRGRWVVRKLRGGNANPMQRLKIAATRRLAAKLSRQSAGIVEAPAPASELEKILDLARWAPSGDNTQPWRFEVAGEDRLVVTVRCSGDVYDYSGGEPTMLSVGFLLETLRVAASAQNRGMTWSYLGETAGLHRVAVDLPAAADIAPDATLSFLTLRSVDRRAYRAARLTPAQKAALTAALGRDLTIEWHESLGERWHAASINAQATGLRLRIPEAYEVHRRVVDWQHAYSPTGIPGKAIGLDPFTRRLTQWLMQKWRRVDGANRWGGTGLAQLEMDLIPGLFCAAHFTIRTTSSQPLRPMAILVSGQHLQRFWLTASQLGLVMQPSLAPLCFVRHAQEDVAFTRDPKMRRRAQTLATAIAGGPGERGRVIFRGRIGRPVRRDWSPRSIRRPLAALLTEAGLAPADSPLNV